MAALEPSEPTRAARERLRLAAAARAAIDHPNLIRAWPVGEGGGRLFVAFERSPHPSLTELLAAAPLEPTECARILDGAAAGVDALSQRALVARDLTPERVLVHPEHGGVLMDLGIPPELMRGVPLEQDPDLAFRSPEELERKPVDLRSAVYSLGAILLAALTALPPDRRMTVARARLSDRRATLAPEIDAVVARAMARDPSERFASAEALSGAAAAALGADLAPKILPGHQKPTERLQQPVTKRVPRSPQRNARHSMTAPPTKDPALPFYGQRRSSEVPRSPRRCEPRHWSRAAQGVAARFPGAVRRCSAMISALLALAGTFERRAHAGLRSSASAVGPIATGAASVARRGANLVQDLFRRVCRLLLAAARRGAVVAAGAGRRGHRALRRLQHSAPSVLQGAGARLDRSAGDGWKLGGRLVGSGTAGVTGAFGPRRGRGRARRPAANRTASQRAFTHPGLLLPAVGAIVASALSGIALGRAFEPEGGPSSVSRTGLTAQLPSGWAPADPDPVLPTLSSAIAAAPSGEAGAGFLAGKVSSLGAAERMLARLQRESEGRTHVWLGGLNAWQYAGLRPRPRVVGTGYLIPTMGGAVLGLCHASTNEAPVRLAECKRAATTLAIRGERPRPLSAADRSDERVIRVIASLRTNRSEGRRRLDAAELRRGQARSATSLQLSHNRAARSLDRISALENGYSLGNLSAAVRKAAAAYGRLAHAASVSNRSAYRQARYAVGRYEEALRRELARTGDA